MPKKIKTCKNCAYSLWDKDKRGRTMWSYKGRCIWSPKKFPLSVSYPRLKKERIKPDMENCCCWRDIKEITPSENFSIALLVYDIIKIKSSIILVLKDDGKIYYLNNELFVDSLKELILSNYIVRNFYRFNKNETVVNVIDELLKE